MPQLFPRWSNSVARLAFATLLLCVPAVVAGLMLHVRSDWFTGAGIAPLQPVPFSHAHHSGKLGIDCRYCHTGVESSPVAGIPPTRTCMTCHSQLWTEAEALAPVRESMASGQSLRWTRVTDLADYAYFDHAVHVHNGVGCASCHGAVQTMPLTMAPHAFHMGFCLDCHRDPGPNLRPPARITDMDWSPVDGAADTRALLAHYDIRSERLDDCSICHR